MRAPRSLIPSRLPGARAATGRRPRLLLALLSLLLATGCAVVTEGTATREPSSVPTPLSPATASAPTPTESPRPPAILVVIGDEPNESEAMLVQRLQASGSSVAVTDDDELDAADLGAPDVIVLSKTVESAIIGASLRDACAGILFWEDNQQQSDRLATIDARDLPDTAWHLTGTTVALDPSVDDALRAGLAGTVTLLTQPDEITYAPRLAGRSTLAPDALRIGEVDAAGEERWALYAIEVGAPLADGTAAAGRRYFFGLYDDTFRLLTPEGLALFDAAVAWAAAPSLRGECG